MSHPSDGEMISRVEFGRRAGVDPVQVRRAIKIGALPDREDKLLPANLTDGQWRKPNRRTVSKRAAAAAIKDGTTETVPPARTTRRAPETPEQAAERIVTQTELLSLEGALKLKENYLGRLKQLEYDIKAGAVHNTSSCTTIVGQEYARVRTKVLAIPSEQAPALFRCQSVAEIEDALRGALVEALEALIRDEQSTGA